MGRKKASMFEQEESSSTVGDFAAPGKAIHMKAFSGVAAKGKREIFLLFVDTRKAAQK